MDSIRESEKSNTSKMRAKKRHAEKRHTFTKRRNLKNNARSYISVGELLQKGVSETG